MDFFSIMREKQYPSNDHYFPAHKAPCTTFFFTSRQAALQLPLLR